MTTSELAGKTVLLTGATDGLGRALAQHLAGPGTTLLLHGRDQKKLDEVAATPARDHRLCVPRRFRRPEPGARARR